MTPRKLGFAASTLVQSQQTTMAAAQPAAQERSWTLGVCQGFGSDSISDRNNRQLLHACRCLRPPSMSSELQLCCVVQLQHHCSKLKLTGCCAACAA